MKLTHGFSLLFCLLVAFLLCACSAPSTGSEMGSDSISKKTEQIPLSDAAWLGFADSTHTITQKSPFITSTYTFSSSGELIEYTAKGQGLYSATYQFSNGQIVHSELEEYRYDLDYEDYGKAILDYTYVKENKDHTLVMAKNKDSEYVFAELFLDGLGRVAKMLIGGRQLDLTYKGGNALLHGEPEIPMLLLADLSAQNIIRPDSTATFEGNRPKEYKRKDKNNAPQHVTITYYGDEK